ncbi:MAG: 50S ribosomal protein L17 [Candidatus Omnitrophica bacterium]|nr:50S ribosomal protein L17 [Candidatus Omnitrophota bacterium]MBU4487555.1 50S ribosomal protein L17 [Candidatus Omnitrophota bacterium]MCG2705795.1 50S ribosomal protein L17 [Candidatus Omnitrophota bacterium]
MRHRRRTNKLSRNTANRKALLRSLARSLLLHEHITTTYKKAKVASSLADKLITLGKENTITAKKRAISILGSKELINKLFDDIAPRFAKRQGGYTRVLHMMPRPGDGAEMAVLEFTERKIVEKKVKAKKAKKLKEEGKSTPAHRAEKDHPEAEKVKPPPPPKSVMTAEKEKAGEEKAREKAKSEGQKLQHGFLKGLRGYFHRKSG